jgi:NAD(P)-dependent dehydrogenase (short-subunit alcohol dehydrogenase family)
LTGRVAIVTGAATGIGLASARLLAAHGATVVGVDLDKAGPETERAHAVDVADRDALTAVIRDTVDAFGRLDVMANVAGLPSHDTALTMTADQLDRVMDVNVKGTVYGCQAAAAHMLAQGSGSIVNFASSVVDGPGAGVCSYAMSKAAITQYTRALAAEVAGRGVRVNAIAPGVIRTRMTAATPAILERAVAGTPMGRIGEPDEVARAVLYLASDAAAFVTGQVLRPNGGATMPW